MPPTLEKNTEMNGETLAKVFKEKQIYLRPSKQIIEGYVPVGLPSKKKRFSPDDVFDVSSDSVSDGNGSDDDALLERPEFATAVHKLPESKIALTVETENVSSPASNGDQSVEVKYLSMEPSSSNKLGKCKPKDYRPVINIFNEYDALLLSSEFDIDENFDAAEAVNDACQNLQTSGTEPSSSIPVKTILGNLASALNDKEISKFNISRNHLWECAKRGFNRKSFSPTYKMLVKFTDDIGNSEGAVDLGRPKRELLTLLLHYLQNSSMFIGDDSNKFMTSNTQRVNDSDYFLAGRIIAVSLVHGGPAPKFYSPILFDALYKDPRNILVKVDDVPDRNTQSILMELKSIRHVESANNFIEKTETLFTLAGTNCFVANEKEIEEIANQVAHRYVLSRCNIAISQFKEGLETLGALNGIKEHCGQFKYIFCFPDTKLTVGDVSNLFAIEFSLQGSNRCITEERIISFWLDLLQDIEGEYNLLLSEILFFITGCRDIPPLGFYPHLLIEFLHEPEADGKQSQLPKANTCANVAHLPVVHTSYSVFKEKMEFGVQGSRSFGYAYM